jgi:hypothetical protein
MAISTKTLVSVTFPIAPPGLLIKGVLQEDTNEAKKNIEAGGAAPLNLLAQNHVASGE